MPGRSLSVSCCTHRLQGAPVATIETPAEAAESRPRRGRSRARFVATLVVALGLLFGVPWWTLVLAPGWPGVVTTVGTVAFAGVLVAFPFLMFRGHGRGLDWAART